MWYHYLILLVGLYLVGSAVYSMVMTRGPWFSRYVFNGLYIAIGIAITNWAWANRNPPSAIAQLMQQGGRRSYKSW
jgi:hypothetical protein